MKTIFHNQNPEERTPYQKETEALSALRCAGGLVYLVRNAHGQSRRSIWEQYRSRGESEANFVNSLEDFGPEAMTDLFGAGPRLIPYVVDVLFRRRVDVQTYEFLADYDTATIEDAVAWMADRANVGSSTVLLTAVEMGGIKGIVQDYRRKMQRPKTEKPPFATLHEEFRAALGDTKRIGYPLDVLDKDVRARADAACREIIPVMHRAHRMVLDDDFAELAGNMSRQQPRELARMMEIARPPFNTLWVEWRQMSRMNSFIAHNYLKDSDIPDRVGVLIQPFLKNKPDDHGVYHATIVSGYPDQCGPAPIGMLFSFTGTVTEWGPDGLHPLLDMAEVSTMQGEDRFSLRSIEEAPIGQNYMDTVRRRYEEQELLAAYIGKHGSICLAPPFGPLHHETMMHARDSGDKAAFERQQEFLGITAREMSGLLRYLIAVFGLYQTGGGEFIMSEAKQTVRRMVRLKPLPAYEYRVLKLRRPTTPKIVKKTLPSYGSLGRRFHNVPQSWHHRRLATAECARHPRVCPFATWAKVFDEETGKQIGSDRQECGICHRQKWLVPAHSRGDKKLGIIDKGYEITASLPSSHRAETVIDAFPKGVKLKSLPTFDEVAEGRETHGK